MLGDFRSGSADQQRGAGFRAKRFTQHGVIAVLVPATEDDPESAVECADGLEGGVHAGGFGIVVIADTRERADELQAMLHRGECCRGLCDLAPV